MGEYGNLINILQFCCSVLEKVRDGMLLKTGLYGPVAWVVSHQQPRCEISALTLTLSPSLSPCAQQFTKGIGGAAPAGSTSPPSCQLVRGPSKCPDLLLLSGNSLCLKLFPLMQHRDSDSQMLVNTQII